MNLNIKSFITACAAALALAGCVSLPGSRDTTPDRSIASSYAPPDEVSFSVSGEFQPNNEQCFVRFEVGYSPELEPQRQMTFDLEFEMLSEGDWIGISWYEGMTHVVPGDSPVGKPFRGDPHREEVMDYLLMERLNLSCETLRARLIMKTCEPGPCPGFIIDDRDNLFPLQVVDTGDASASTQTAYLSRVEQAVAQLHQVGVRSLFDATAGAGWGDRDDYISTRIYAGVHLPSVTWPDDRDRIMDSPAVVRPRESRTVMFEAGSSLGLPISYELRWHHAIVPSYVFGSQ